MGLWNDFKTFAVKGNVIDLAVGVVIGAAFGKIVSSLVADVIMPPVGVLLSGVDFTKLTIILKEAVGDKAAVTINYGKFIQTVIDFAIVAWVIFITVKGFNKLKKKEEAKPTPPPDPSKEELLLTEIRDLLQKNLDK